MRFESVSPALPLSPVATNPARLPQAAQFYRWARHKAASTASVRVSALIMHIYSWCYQHHGKSSLCHVLRWHTILLYALARAQDADWSISPQAPDIPFCGSA